MVIQLLKMYNSNVIINNDSSSAEERLIQDITHIIIKNDSPRLPNTYPISAVLRNSIPSVQDLMKDFLPWLFQPGLKILLKEPSTYLEWKEITFSSPNNFPQVLCQQNQEGFYNIVNLQYAIYEEGGQKVFYNTQIQIPMQSNTGETDPWGLKKNIAPRPFTIGGYVLTGKGMQKYPISIEHDRYSFGLSKKKLTNQMIVQFSFTIDKDMVHPANKGQVPQHFKITLDLRSLNAMISCNNSHTDLQLPEVNIISLSAILTNRTIYEVGESLKSLDYLDKTQEIHAIIDGMIVASEDAVVVLSTQNIENLMSQYSIFTDDVTQINKMKGYMLEVQIRRMLMALFVPEYYPDRDCLQRKRYLSSGKYFAQCFMSKMIDICNIKNNKLIDRTKVAKEVEKILSYIPSTINTDISTGTFEKKSGVWVHDASTSMINTISKLTVCAKKLRKEITKDLVFRYYHQSQTYFLCLYDTPEHGENVGLVNSTTVITHIAHNYPQSKLTLVKELMQYLRTYYTTLSNRDDNTSKSKQSISIIIDDIFYNTISEEDAIDLYYALRYSKRANEFSRKDFGVVLDPYLFELRINVASGRLVQPILVVTDGVLEMTKQHINLDGVNNIEDFMKRYPHVLEYIDCDSFQMSSKRDGKIISSINEYDKLSLDERKKSDFCLLAEWGYLGWNINHNILRNHDEAIRSVFYTSLSKSGISNKILAKNTFEGYNKSLYTSLTFFKTPVMDVLSSDRLAYAHLVWCAVIPANNGLNQEDGTIVNLDAADIGLLSSIRIIKYNILVDRAARITNTNNVVTHANQSKIDPVNGLPIIGSYLVKGDAIVRNYEQISNRLTGVNHKDCSEVYFEHTPARIESIILSPENTSRVSLLMSTYNPLMNGDKLTTISAQKSTAVAVIERINLPCTIDGMYPDLIMSPTGILSRKTLSAIVGNCIFLKSIVQWSTEEEKPEPIQVRMSPIEKNFDWIKHLSDTTESFKKAQEMYGLWPNQSPENLAASNMVLINPYTKEIMEDTFFAPMHVYRSKHLANPKKNVCQKGKTNQDTGQNTSKRKSGGSSKFDEMSRNSALCYGAAFTLKELLGDPIDRQYIVHICKTCGMNARQVSEDEFNYYVCDVCFNKYNTSDVIPVQLTYAARKFLDYPRARGASIILHPKKRIPVYKNVE